MTAKITTLSGVENILFNSVSFMFSLLSVFTDRFICALLLSCMALATQPIVINTYFCLIYCHSYRAYVKKLHYDFVNMNAHERDELTESLKYFLAQKKD